MNDNADNLPELELDYEERYGELVIQYDRETGEPYTINAYGRKEWVEVA